MELNAEEKEPATMPSSPIRADEPDPRQSLQHVLAAANPAGEATPRPNHGASTALTTSAKRPTIWVQEPGKENTEDERSVQNDSYTRAADINSSHIMTVAHSRRNANGTIGSVYSGNKIRHLKKEDGIPLWRKDIQFAFLRAVFEDKTPVFTKASDGTTGHNFADIYIDAMARSSKTSKILREKLLMEREAAVNMAMVCLLVNVGRMNTTLNFFPEMRAQLRTYHSIPCLQAHQDPNAYKQLQDAPRLKSILKGASEDFDQPNTVEKIQLSPIPRTNPVNLIFVLSQYAPKISETHFHQPRDFFDLVIRSTLSSRSRAKAFLWLVWWYLESDFSRKAAENNPFGPGQPGDGTGGLPLKCPNFDHLTEEQANAENVDTEEEKAYGEMKRLERKRILEEDETVGPPMKKGKKGPGTTVEDGLPGSPIRAYMLSDTDRTRSPSPASGLLSKFTSRAGGLPTSTLTSNGHSTRPEVTKNSNRLLLRTKVDQPSDNSSPIPPGTHHLSLHPNIPTNTSHRRSRPETSHQKAVNINRKMRIDHILHKELKSEHNRVRKKKKENSSSFGFTAMSRIIDLPDDYDTDDDGSWGPGGLVPKPGEEEDYGGEALKHKKVLDRAVRRLARDGQGDALGGLAQSYLKSRKRRARRYSEDDMQDAAGNPRNAKRSKISRSRGLLLGPEERRTRTRSRGEGGGGDGGSGGPEDVLDDLDLDLLGESRDGDQVDDEMEEDSGGDESEDGGDDTEDEMMGEG